MVDQTPAALGSYCRKGVPRSRIAVPIPQGAGSPITGWGSGTASQYIARRRTTMSADCSLATQRASEPAQSHSRPTVTEYALPLSVRSRSVIASTHTSRSVGCRMRPWSIVRTRPSTACQRTESGLATVMRHGRARVVSASVAMSPSNACITARTIASTRPRPVQVPCPHAVAAGVAISNAVTMSVPVRVSKYLTSREVGSPSRSYDWAGLRTSRGLIPRALRRRYQSHL